MMFSLLLLALPTLTSAAVLQQITANITNPTKVGFFLYVPDTLPPNPPILVNPHWCHGSAQATFQGTQFARLADAHGFLVIYPDSPNAADKCWDVSSAQTLRHGGGGDSLGIVSMVEWALARHGADRGRVFVAGVSSGAMMTSTLLGAYPDVFAAGSAWAGVPFGCFAPAANDGVHGAWSDDCAKGRVAKAAAEWAAGVRAAFPGYEGWRPRVQIAHGTKDDVLDYKNFEEEVKLWTALLGLGDKVDTTVRDAPLKGWTKAVYGGGWFEAMTANGVTHDIPVNSTAVVEWFDLPCKGEGCFRWGKGGPSRST
jgi:acetylxylan esterase